MEPLRLEIWVNALPEFVWWAWTITERVERWFSPEANIIAELGGAYELFFDPEDHSQQSTIGCVITHIEPMKKLRFTWKGPDQFRKLMNSPEAVTSVQVTLRNEIGGTKVFVEHGGWKDGEAWSTAREWHRRAWINVLNSLKSTLESKKSLLNKPPT